MAVVVGVHGIFQAGRSSEELTRAWARALQQGGRNLAVPPSGPEPTIVVPHFSPLLTAPPINLGPDSLEGEPLTDGEWALLQSVLDDLLAGLTDAEVDILAASAVTLAGIPRVIAGEDLRRISAVDARWRGGGRMVLRLVREVHAYLVRPAVGETVRRRLRTAAQPETRVLLGHSLGSIIAYDVLRRGLLPQITTLVTCGSPLAWASIRALLRLEPINVGDRALSKVTWSNCHDLRDPVTGGLTLAPIWAQVTDHQVTNPRLDAHGAPGYLRQRELVLAVRAGVAR